MSSNAQENMIKEYNELLKEHNELVNKCNNDKLEIYSTLTELIVITGLKKRALLYRMIKVKEKYADMPNLLMKKGRSWKIHYTIIQEFMPKRNKKDLTIYTFPWKNMVTWNTRSKYDIDCQKEFINQVKDRLSLYTIYYTIELDTRGFPHVHFLSNANKSELKQAVDYVMDLYLSKREYKLEVSEINNKYCAIKYLDKASMYKGLINPIN